MESTPPGSTPPAPDTPPAPPSSYEEEKEKARLRRTPHAELMAEAKREFEAMMEAARAARKGGRPKKKPAVGSTVAPEREAEPRARVAEAVESPAPRAKPAPATKSAARPARAKTASAAKSARTKRARVGTARKAAKKATRKRPAAKRAGRKPARKPPASARKRK